MLASWNALGNVFHFLKEYFSYRYFKDVIPLSSDLTFVSDENSVLILIYVYLDVVCLSFPIWLLLRFFYLFLFFSNLITMSFGVVSFVLVVLGVYWAFLFCGFTAFFRFENFSAIISSYVFLLPLDYLALFHKSLKFQFIFFNLFFLLQFGQVLLLFSHWYFALAMINLLLSLFRYCVFQPLKVPLRYFL